MQTEHYFTKSPKSKLNPRIFSVEFKGRILRFHTGSGVFSPKRIDLGTRVLVEFAQVKKNDKVLDLGCGYGAVGVFIAKKFSGISLAMCDVNERAVMLARKNAEENCVVADVFQSDGFENVRGKFDVILLNPPMTAGRKLCFRMLEDSRLFLKNGGSLQIVARHNKGGKVLQDKMCAVFGNVETVAKKSGFRVYLSYN